MLGKGEFAPHNWLMDLIAKSEEYFCEHLPKKFEYYCKMVYETAIFLDGGFDYDEVSLKQILLLINLLYHIFKVQHEPDRASYIPHSCRNIKVHCRAVPAGVQDKLVIFP